MKTLIYITSLAGILFMSLNTGAQSNQPNLPDLAIETNTYRTAIGLRGGETSGLTIKHFVSGKDAIEGIIGIWNHGARATVLYERHVQAFNVSGLNWYYGGGAHGSVHSGHHLWHSHKHEHTHYHRGSIGLGVDGIFGMEYKFAPVPIALSFDVKPYFEVNFHGGAWTSLDPGLGIKVTF